MWTHRIEIVADFVSRKGADRIFFEWTIESVRGGARGVSVWEVEDHLVKRDRSYRHAWGGPGASAARHDPAPREEPR